MVQAAMNECAFVRIAQAHVHSHAQCSRRDECTSSTGNRISGVTKLSAFVRKIQEEAKDGIGTPPECRNGGGRSPQLRSCVSRARARCIDSSLGESCSPDTFTSNTNCRGFARGMLLRLLTIAEGAYNRSRNKTLGIPA